MILSNMEKELIGLIESIADGLICELEEVATSNNLPTDKKDLVELAKQALDRTLL